jgi:tetratricopeptide (TPR) repeat protein
MIVRGKWLVLAAASFAVGCAQQGASRRAAETPEVEEAAGGWVPAAGADLALERVWSAGPFAAAPTDLALASGGRVGTAFSSEILVHESSVSVDEKGLARRVERSVWRVLSDSPDQTLTVSWAPWRQARPTVRARVISENGAERWLDASSVVEAQGSPEGLQLSDRKQLQVPLPGARRGVVVEYETVIVDTRPSIEGLGVSDRWTLWSPQPIRHQRHVVEVAGDVPLSIHVVGVPTPKILGANGRQRVTLEVPELRFKPFALSKAEQEAQRPVFAWSTVPSWAEVANRYGPLLAPALSDAVTAEGLDEKLRAASSVEAKAQAINRWIADHVRYTAVHLGEGAFVPTKPSAVVSRGYGDCKDLSVLLVALARRAGLEAEVALVAHDSVVPLDATPGIEAFNHAIVAVKVPGRAQRLWIDPTAPQFPVGTLPEGVRDQRALVARAGGALVPTPTRAETSARIAETIFYELAPFGEGEGRLTAEYFGEAEGIMRARAKKCDAEAAKDLASHAMTTVFADSQFTASVSACKPGDGPLTLTATAAKVDRLDTGDHSVRALFPSRIADLLLSKSLLGEAPESDERTPEQRLEDQRRLQERFGLSEEDFENMPKALDSAVVIDRIFKVRLPSRFVVTNLPPRRSIAMGPASWTEEMVEPRPGEVEVRFHFEASKVDWTAAEVKAFRAAFWKRFQEPVPTLTFRFGPSKLLDDEKAADAVSLARKWLAERPTDAITRARYARMLLTLGLGDLAKVEAERAWKDAPNEPLVLLVRGDTTRADEHGVLYRAGYDRSASLAAFTKAHTLIPEHGWATDALVRTLRISSDGQLESRWTPEIAEAARLLEQLVDQNRADDDDLGALTDIYLKARKRDALKRLFERSKALREDQQPVMQTMRDAVNGTSTQTLQRIARINDQDQRLEQLLMAVSSFAHLHRYADAVALLDGFKPGPGQETQFQGVQLLKQMLRPVPVRTDVSNPEAAARTLLSALVNAGSVVEASRSLSRLASKTGAEELDGTANVFRYTPMPPLKDSTFSYEYLFHRGACAVSGKGSIARVKCTVPELRSLSVTTYWSKDGSTWKLESLGRPSTLATRAWTTRTTAPAEAALWVDWVLDDMQARQATKGHAGVGAAYTILRNVWSRARRDDPKALAFAASTTFFMFGDVTEGAPEEALETFRQGLSTLSGNSRREGTYLLASGFRRRGQPGKAAELIRPLAESENEPEVWRMLSSTELEAGNTAAATSLVQKALEASPQDVEWRTHQGYVLLEQGRWAEAMEVLKTLRAEKGDAVNVQNNLLWAMALAGAVDDAAEREAALLAGEKASVFHLSTSAHVMMERGRLTTAARLISRRIQALDDEAADDAQWLARGRLLHLLGFTEASRKALAHIDPKSRALLLAARRLAPGAPQASR